MANASVASSSLVQAYIPSAQTAYGAFPKALVSCAAAALSPHAARFANEAGAQPTSARLLEGTWAPPPLPRHAPKPAAPQTAAKRIALQLEAIARALPGREELVPGQPLSARRSGRPLGARGGGASTGDGGTQGSSVSSRSSVSGGRGLGEMGLGPVSASSRTVTHATTPSWRSRSFPARPHFAEVEEPAYPAPTRPERSRLPPLPLEARWAAAAMQSGGHASSEVRRLEGIDSEVYEANALLVESFLNVKRRPPAHGAALSSCCEGDEESGSLPEQGGDVRGGGRSSGS
mmetsp:Transcript_86179/g.252136  ORF Transcript_86179/g.252136 Transcript_86179/m.252136 type:complete len:290 (-) Transcript_86179:21-890(-)